ncbi:MAG: hypothetical protein LBQ22_06980 [Bacteroidales bacterium]|jgi:hypothetical protein|nr:hypothetical protein [Bacteroidales bacterium]
MKKIILILICLYTVSAYAQKNSTFFEVPEKSLVFDFGYGIPFFQNNLLKSDFWNKKNNFTIQPNVSFRKQLSKVDYYANNEATPSILAIGGGLGISFLKKTVFFDNYSETITDIYDADNKLFTANLLYNNIEESVFLTYLDIPLYLEFGRPNKKKISGWFQIGLKTSILLTKKISGSGFYTSKGYYPDWDIELYNIPELGFYTGGDSYTEPEYKLSTVVLWGTASGGIIFPFSNWVDNFIRHTMLRIGAGLDYSLTKISKSTSDPFFNGASYRINQSNILGGNGSRILSLKLEIGLIYSL